jgi:hypothetical protein
MKEDGTFEAYREEEIAYRISVGKPERKVYLDVLDIDGRKILKCI